MCVCVCVFTGIQSGQCVQILRLWCYNLGKLPLLTNTLLLSSQLILAPPAPPVSAAFLGHSVFLLHPNTPSSASICFHITCLSVTPAIHILSWIGTFPTGTFPTPANSHPLPLVSAPRATCLHLPPFPASV